MWAFQRTFAPQKDGTKNTLNVQRVIPISVSKNWNLIARIIMPLIYQDDVLGNSGSQSGLGDINPIWAGGGDDDREDLSSTFVQPFLSKGLGKGRTINLNSESSYNWKTNDWNIPINLAYSKVMKLGKQLVSLKGGVRH